MLEPATCTSKKPLWIVHGLGIDIDYLNESNGCTLGGSAVLKLSVADGGPSCEPVVQIRSRCRIRNGAGFHNSHPLFVYCSESGWVLLPSERTLFIRFIPFRRPKCSKYSDGLWVVSAPNLARERFSMVCRKVLGRICKALYNVWRLRSYIIGKNCPNGYVCVYFKTGRSRSNRSADSLLRNFSLLFAKLHATKHTLRAY